MSKRNPEQEKTNIFQEILERNPKLANFITRAMLGSILLLPGVGIAAQDGGEGETIDNVITSVTPESPRQINSITIDIPNKVNIRSINPENFGSVNPFAPRTNVEVVGYVADGPLQVIKPGTWLVTADKHAVHASLIEVAANQISNLDLYHYVGNGYVVVELEVPVGTPEPLAAPTAPTEVPADIESTVTPVTPVDEELVFPEIMPTATITHFTVEGVKEGVFPTETSTVEINPDHLLPYPFGIIPSGFSELTNVLNNDREPDPEIGRWPKTAISGKIVKIIERRSGNNEYNYIELQTITPEGNEVVAIIRLSNYIRYMPITDQGELAITQEASEVLWDTNDVADNGVIIAPTRELKKGDHITLDVNIVEIEDNRVTGANGAQNMRLNGIADGSIYGVFEAIDNGEIDGTPAANFYGGYNIIYNQD